MAKRYGMTGPFVLGAFAKALAAILFMLGPSSQPTPALTAALRPSLLPTSPVKTHTNRSEVGIDAPVAPAASGRPDSVTEADAQPHERNNFAPMRNVGWTAMLRQERRFFTGACLAICGLTVLRQALAILTPLLGRELGLSVQAIGAAQSAGATVDSIMFLPTGYGYDRFGRKAMVVPALLVMSCGWVVLSFATSARSLLRGTMLIGLGHGLTAGIQSLTVQDFAPPPPATQHFISLYMLLTDGVALGGPLLLTRLAQVTSVAVATRTTASFGILAAGWYWFRVPEVLKATVNPC